MIVVFTRDEAARDALALALSRFEYPFRLVASTASARDVLAAMQDVRILVLGPSFRRDEAVTIRAEVPRDVAVILLEDHLDPLPAELIETPAVARVPVPVRARTLRKAVEELL